MCVCVDAEICVDSSTQIKQTCFLVQICSYMLLESNKSRDVDTHTHTHGVRSVSMQTCIVAFPFSEMRRENNSFWGL